MDKVNTNQMVNYMAKMSPDGRFFSAAAFTADVKIWELQWGKAENDPVKVAKVMNLQVRAHVQVGATRVHVDDVATVFPVEVREIRSISDVRSTCREENFQCKRLVAERKIR